MKFFDQARFTQSRLAHNHHQLTVALPRSLPAPHQDRNLFLATLQWREMTLPRTTSTPARPYKPVQGHRLRHTLKFMTAAFFNDEETGDLVLHLRRHYDRARLCQRLYPRSNVRRVTVNLASRIDHDRSDFNPDARVKRRLAGSSILAVHLGERPLDRECGPRRPLGVILLRHRMTEQHHQPVAQLLGDMAAHLPHCSAGGIEISADEVAPFFGIELRGNAGRTDEIAEHHRDIAALAGGLSGDRRW